MEMKICRECKKEVPCKNWSYKSDCCRSCYGRILYAERNPEYKKLWEELKNLTKYELIIKILAYKSNIVNRNNISAKKNYVIKETKRRLIRIRKQLDFLIDEELNNDKPYQVLKSNK